MKTINIIITTILILGSLTVSAQVAINTDGSTADASSMLDISTNDKGVLIPRLTQTQRNAITSPVSGLLIYKTDNTPGFYFYNGTAWVVVGSEAVDINSLADGKTGGNSLFLGNSAGANDDGTDNKNVGVGGSALSANTSGSFNTATGREALTFNTTGNSNTAHGQRALYTNTTGISNTASGSDALFGNITGNYNTAVGYRNMFSKNSGSSNTALGAFAGSNNTSGSGNVFLGYNAGLGEYGSNKLYISNSDTSNPLLYGDFDAKTLVLNGNVGIKETNPTAELHVEGSIKADGLIESTSGGIKYPDGTTQSTAGFWTASGNNVYNNNSGNVGISEASPTAQLHVGGIDGIIAEGTQGSGTVMNLGHGARMHWYPRKSAFRAGNADGTKWDDNNIGVASFATGYVTRASGYCSVALGNTTTASGDYSTAMGTSTTAMGDYSTAMGFTTTASGTASTAMGNTTTASGASSTATGFNTTASGIASTAMGSYVNAYGDGSFYIGDYSTTTVMSYSNPNRMHMRFHNGYRLYTNSDLSTGVSMDNGMNAWGTFSDSTKKTNYLPANGEYFLNSISKLRLGSWNYKTQDPKDFRHYGPMAQEIFHYFGKDAYGTIGNNTTLTTADMDGIMMIAIQALERRTAENQKLEVRIQKLEEEKAVIADQNTELIARLAKLEELVTVMLDSKTEGHNELEASLDE